MASLTTRKHKTGLQKLIAVITGEKKSALELALRRKALLDTLIEIEAAYSAHDEDPTDPMRAVVQKPEEDVHDLGDQVSALYKKWVQHALHFDRNKPQFNIGDDMRARLDRVTTRLVEEADDQSIDASDLYHIADVAPNVTRLYRAHAEKMWNIGPYDTDDIDAKTPDHIADEPVLSSGGTYYFGARLQYDDYHSHIYPTAMVGRDGDLNIAFADFAGNAADIGDLDDHLTNPITDSEKLERDRELRRLAIFVHTAAHIFDDNMSPDARKADMPHPYL